MTAGPLVHLIESAAWRAALAGGAVRPEDAEGMRFPHLYGPLPVSAVVAVLPWRPPTPLVLPRPDDALGRALALQLSLPVRRAAEVRDVPGGVAVLDPRFRWSRDDNRLRRGRRPAGRARSTATTRWWP